MLSCGYRLSFSGKNSAEMGDVEVCLPARRLCGRRRSCSWLRCPLNWLGRATTETARSAWQGPEMAAKLTD